jgi:hypothetical protein
VGARPEGSAGLDHDRDGVRRRLFPGRPDPAATDAEAVVEATPGVLPALDHVVRFDDVEADRRLVRIDGIRAVELLDSLGKDVQEERELRLAADDDVPLDPGS